MTTFVLVMFVYAGVWSTARPTDPAAVSLLAVPGFKTLAECRKAGDEGDVLTMSTPNEGYRYVCLEQSK